MGSVPAKISSWLKADEVGVQILELQAEIDENRAEYQRVEIEAKEKMANANKPREEQKAKLEKKLEEFCESKKDEIEGQSKTLPHIIIGWRKSKKILDKLKIDEVIKRFKGVSNRFEKLFVKYKPSLDKSAIKTAIDNGDVEELKMKKCGIEYVEEEKWYWKPNTSK